MPRINLRRRRRQARQRSPLGSDSVNATESPVASNLGRLRQKAAEDSLRREIARIVPSDAEIDTASEITQADIDSAVKAWDDAQRADETGLEGLLDARLTDD